MTDRPSLLAVDADGYVWRVYPADPENGIAEAIWSMAPSNPDNEPIPEPVTFYKPVTFEPTEETP